MNALVKEARPMTKNIAARVKAIDWERVSKDLDAHGCAMIEGLVTGKSATLWRCCTRSMTTSAAAW